METTTKKRDVFQIVTDRIIEMLEKGVVPWKQQWQATGATLPMNLSTRKRYRGINILLLASLGYERNYFLTRNQLLEFGGRVKDGEKPAMVVYWKTFDGEGMDEEEKPKRKPVLRYYSVYNIAQCDGIPEKDIPAPPQEIKPVESCEAVIKNMPDKPKILLQGYGAYYSPGRDYISLPPPHYFDDAEAYYETLFHELIHSTGHKKRLNRKELAEDIRSMNQRSYSIEELTAEIGACFLNAHTGIENKHFENNVAYIGGWLSRLKNDNRFIVYASTQAQKAFDFILGVKPEAVGKEDRS